MEEREFVLYSEGMKPKDIFVKLIDGILSRIIYPNVTQCLAV